jgi:YVTN family beta-propeller protein
MAGVGYGSAPTPDGKWLLVALPDVNKVAVIDLGTMKVARNIDVAAYPQAIAVSPDGKTAYASCMHADKVAEMDIASGKTRREIATGKQTDGVAWAGAQ